MPTTATRSTTRGTGREGTGEGEERSSFRWWWWVAPFLVAVGVPALYRQRFHAIHPFRLPQYLAGTLLVLIAALLVVAVLSSGFRRNRHEAWAAGTAFVIVFFHWPTLGRIGTMAFGSTAPVLVELVPVVIGFGLVLLVARFADEPVVLAVMTILGLVMTWSVWSVTLPRVVADPMPVSVTPAVPGAPDALLLVLDGYARADVLRTDFGYDNSPFLDALADRGFQVAEASTAAYSFTHVSLPAMYELDYVLPPATVSDEDYARLRRLRSGDAAMVRSFAEAGYETTFFENPWPGSQCGAIWDVCVRDGLWYASAYQMGQITPLAPLLRTALVEPFTMVGIDHLRRLADVLGRDADQPRFIVAHVTVPHAPVQADAGCRLHSGEERGGLSLALPGMDPDRLAARKAAYVEQIRCVNALVLEALDAFLAAEPDAVIMITSDHGTDSRGQATTDPTEWTGAAVRERMATLGAYRLGDCPAPVPADVNTVNGARILTACALDRPLVLLPNALFASPREEDPSEPVVDLSEHLPSLRGG